MAAVARDIDRALGAEFMRLYPDEAASHLEGGDPGEVAAALAAAPPESAAGVLERLGARTAAAALAALPDDPARAAIAAMNPMRTASVLATLEPSGRERVLALSGPSLAAELRDILSYPPDTAGALMDARITAFRSDLNVDEALRKLRTFKEKEFAAIYLQDESGRLSGAVPLADLATAAANSPLRDLVREQPTAVSVVATREEIVDFLSQAKLVSVPVVDVHGRLVGVIRHSALVAAAQAEASADIQTMVGASKDERALSPMTFAIRQRLPWLQINLATAFLAAFVVGIFEGTIAQITALAVLLPVVAGQSGNTGMQALAVSTRSLALREIRPRQWPQLILKETGTGIVNGLAVALVTMLGVFIWSRSLGLVMVIGIAMVVSMLIAGVSGAAIPLILKAVGQDPATASSIILTTVTDVMGFLTFLGLATIFAERLGGL